MLSDHARILILQRELQNMRLELQEQRQMLAQLKEESQRQRREMAGQINEAIQAQMEQLLSDMAAPMAQLSLQAHLLEIEGKPVQAKDVLLVARRFVRTLEAYGLTLEGQVGQTVPFDPNRHEPLSATTSPVPEQAVVVRFTGVSYQGKILRKAGVEMMVE